MPEAGGDGRELTQGYQLGKYTLLERIGRGGEAVVWSAWDQLHRRVAALKISAGEPGRPAGPFPPGLEQQIHLIASLNHPRILPLYEFGQADSFFYIAMRYSSAGSLALRLLQGRPSLPAALGYAAQVADALQYLHGRQVVHRDLKPSNILDRKSVV